MCQGPPGQLSRATRRATRRFVTRWVARRPLWRAPPPGRVCQAHCRHACDRRTHRTRRRGRRTIVALRVSRKRIRTAIKRGEIVTIAGNRLALSNADRSKVVAQEAGGCLSHLSAAMHWGWEVTLPPDSPQITVSRNRALPTELSTPIELFRRDLRRDDIDGWATTPLATVVACARDLPFGPALAVADSALRHGDVSQNELSAAVGGMRGARGRAARLVVGNSDRRSANAFESALRAIAIQAGLSVIPQYEIRLSGFTVHPDLADPFRGIVLEADSWSHHADKGSHDRDCARYNALVAAGWLVLRFTWPQVLFAPEYVERTIRTLVATQDHVA